MEKVRCTRNIDCFTKGNEYDYPYAIDDVGQIKRLEGCSLFDMYFKKIETKEEMKKEYDLSKTITRAVKNDDPSIIMKETGRSVEEVSWLVRNQKENECLSDVLRRDGNKGTCCLGLSCIIDSCPLKDNRFNAPFTKEQQIQWLKGEIDKYGNPKNKKEEPKPIPIKPLSAYDAVHVDSQEKWDFVSNKLGYTNLWSKGTDWSVFKEETHIRLDRRGCYNSSAYNNILSFEEWLDLTGYYSDWMLLKNIKQFLEDVDAVYNVCNTPIKATDVIPIKNIYEETIAYLKNGELFNTKWVKIGTGLTNDNYNNFESSKKDSTFVSWESESDDYVEYKALPVQHCSKVEFLTNEE